jgi:hypothetical protein
MRVPCIILDYEDRTKQCHSLFKVYVTLDTIQCHSQFKVMSSSMQNPFILNSKHAYLISMEVVEHQQIE